ncbi:sulfur carrier protein ThiS [Pedobacter sp. R20-19]|uniref:sulfur carrier protein ThiS n=1 Tax=Pedobacter sp. R20-19 TaxID=1270196 RepID=UPI0021018A45|nr:sulfur carrier protein ThiS [Pedobacter sp. R20-19]
MIFFSYRMEITVNQQHYQVTEACSMQDLITIVLNTPATGIAVAVNQTIIPKTSWEKQLLHPGDQVIIIKATQGG